MNSINQEEDGGGRIWETSVHVLASPSRALSSGCLPSPGAGLPASSFPGTVHIPALRFCISSTHKLSVPQAFLRKSDKLGLRGGACDLVERTGDRELVCQGPGFTAQPVTAAVNSQPTEGLAHLRRPLGAPCPAPHPPQRGETAAYFGV